MLFGHDSEIGTFCTLYIIVCYAIIRMCMFGHSTLDMHVLETFNSYRLLPLRDIGREKLLHIS